MRTFTAHKSVTARKAHSCEECGVDIAPGQRYRRDSGRFDGHMWSSKYCLSCGDLVDWCWANDIFDHDSGHVAGEMLTQLVEAGLVELIEDETEDHDTVHLTPEGTRWFAVDTVRNYPYLPYLLASPVVQP
ncbi:hypothetical protein [uncultured Deinococcus sp.]|uniref:hypothetical protein n=1 Tax=uncultured Deinococcus sp. TaxID=158789 RepID=UPI0025861306|nr:hypothetical protein [uncultured Deinococcus sp.]